VKCNAAAFRFRLIKEHVAVKRRQFSPSGGHRHYTWVLRKRLTTKFWSPIGLYCVKCTRFGQFILRKIIKIVATRSHIFSLKCTKFDFGCMGLCPRTRWGSLQCSPRPLSWISGVLLLRGGEGRGKRGGKRGGAEIARPDIERPDKSAPYRKNGHRETWQPGTMSPSLISPSHAVCYALMSRKTTELYVKKSVPTSTAAGAAIRTDVCDCGLWGDVSGGIFLDNRLCQITVRPSALLLLRFHPLT